MNAIQRSSCDAKNRIKIRRFISKMRFFLFFLVLFALSASSAFSIAVDDDRLAQSKSAIHQINAAAAAKSSRHLLSAHDDVDAQKELHQHHNSSKCVRPDIEQFPRSFLTRSQRLNGGVIFYLLVSVYMFIGLAIICDDYFVPALEVICKVLNLREDVAGATFMAAGSSAPELATTIISLFIAKV